MEHPARTDSIIPTDSGTSGTPSAELLNVNAVASLLGISSRQVYRLADRGRMPRPVRLGALVRWRRAELLEWIASGCPAAKGGGQ